ncbi:MAG: hypothetical protein M3179_10090, partial [Actinomycetota bacterium]|nr:hypothetical protein [Actinomycetota bacterium]
DIVHVDQGVGNKAASGKVNVLQMIVASAEAANQSNFATGCVNVPNALGPTNPVVGSTKNKLGTDLCLKVTELPKIYFGPVGGSVTTSQVEVTFKPHVDVGLTGLPVVGDLLKAVGQLPVKVTSAGATGTLSGVNCGPTSPGITVSVDTEAVKTSAGGMLDLRLLSDTSNTGDVIATVNVQGEVTGPDQAGTTLTFAHPGEFTPPADSKTTPGSPMRLNMTSTSTGTVHIEIPPSISVDLSAATVAQAVLNAINPATLTDNVLSRLQNLLLSEEYAALGMRVGIADVAALAEFFTPATCGSPTLIG